MIIWETEGLDQLAVARNQYRVGLSRMERAIKERMSSANEIENLMPQDLINAKPAAASLREFLAQVNYLNLWIKQTHSQK